MDDEKIQTDILGFLRAHYTPDGGWGISSDEIKNSCELTDDDLLPNLQYMHEKKWIILDSSRYEYDVYLEAKGMEEFVKRQRQTIPKPTARVGDHSTITVSGHTHEDPKEMLEFYQKEIKTFVDTRQYNMIVVTIDRLYVYLNGIALSKADRYHLTRAMELLSKQSHSLEITSIMLETPNKEHLDQQHKEHIIPAHNDVNNHIDSILRSPQDLKRLTAPLKNKQNFLTNFKKVFVFKKYIEIKKIPDSFYEQIIDDINKTYSAGAEQAILILVQKLFESAIKDVLWKKFKDDSLFFTSNNGRKHFNDIIKDTQKMIKAKKFGHFESELSDVLDFVESIREDRNQTTHNLTFVKSKQEIENMKVDVKKHLEIIFRILNLV